MVLRVLASLVACGVVPGTDVRRAVIEPEPDTAASCDNSVRSVFPEGGASDVFYGTSIEARMDRADEVTLIDVFGADGAYVPGEVAWRANTLVFTPSSPLLPSSAYEVRVRTCSGDVTSSFATSEVGAPVAASIVAGRTYAVGLASARWTEPDGLGDILGQFFDEPLLVGVTGTDPLALSMALGDGEPPQQACGSPSLLQGDLASNPAFTASGEGLTLHFAGVDLPVSDVVVTGAFSADGERVEGVRIRGLADTRAVGASWSDPGDEGSFCAALASTGVACVPCTDGEPWCMVLDLQDATGIEVDGLVLVEDPGCP